MTKKTPRNDAEIYQKLMLTGKHILPQLPPASLDLEVKKLMADNPNATMEDFAKGAQQLAKSIRDGTFQKKLAVENIKNKVKKGKK